MQAHRIFFWRRFSPSQTIRAYYIHAVAILALAWLVVPCGIASSGPTKDEIYSRVLGCLVGISIGDAFGGPVEFANADRVREIVGKEWVDQFVAYPKDFKPNPWGVWEPAAPRGAGTDDTRINEFFVECVIRNQGFINPQFLGIEYIERYRDREKLYPRYTAFAEEHFAWFLDRACAQLGMTHRPSGKAIVVEKEPSLIGLISMAPAGLLFCGEPAKAYRKAYELDFIDVGYAKDATAMLASMISAGLGGNVRAREMVRIGLETDPLGLGEDRPVAKGVRKFLQMADSAKDDQAFVDAVAREVKGWNVFNPIEAIGLPMAAFHRCNGDPLRTIVMAVNDRDLENGKLKKLRDVDCTAGIAGGLVGALRGVQAFPADWVRDTIQANKAIYGIDIEANARRFCEAVYKFRISMFPGLAEPEVKASAIRRILFLGNSITLHGPKADIGWSGNWGMAASSEDKDYVHLVTRKFAEQNGTTPEIMIRNVADFERNYATYNVDEQMKDFFAFDPDLVVLAFGENVPALTSEQAKAQFKTGVMKILACALAKRHPMVVVRSCFWADAAKDQMLKEACQEADAIFVDTGPLGRVSANAARSERSYAHDGVGGHPGDRGMKALADAIVKGISERNATVR